MIVVVFKECGKIEIEYEYSSTPCFSKTDSSQQAQVFFLWVGGSGEHVSTGSC